MREFEPSQPRRLAINPLCARRAADSVNRLGRPAPSIAFFSGTMRFWLKELPAFGGFGDIFFESEQLKSASEHFRMEQGLQRALGLAIGGSELNSPA